ncbi:MAG TPA: dihydrofolate reductase [Candidatus Saccharimonadia bacterium]
MGINLIVAVAENGVIGRNDGSLPWRLPADLARFRQITLHHPIIMGRTTYESIGRILPDRRNIIITRNSSFHIDGAEVVHSLESAIALASAGDKEIFIIGGGSIYEQALPRADVLYLTEVHAEPEGQVLFEYNRDEWEEVERDDRPADDLNQYPYCFVKLVRK